MKETTGSIFNSLGISDERADELRQIHQRIDSPTVSGDLKAIIAEEGLSPEERAFMCFAVGRHVEMVKAPNIGALLASMGVTRDTEGDA